MDPEAKEELTSPLLPSSAARENSGPSTFRLTQHGIRRRSSARSSADPGTNEAVIPAKKTTTPAVYPFVTRLLAVLCLFLLVGLLAKEARHTAEWDKSERMDMPAPTRHIMKAFVEPIHFEDWEVKPLPTRKSARKDLLQAIPFPKVQSCGNLPENWPADEYPDQDTFLPWIHDVFPTEDGKFIQIVAQNRRRCHTGTTEAEKEILFRTQPSVALFQHVPVKRIQLDGETRYKLTSHEEADSDGVATRFICRFKPTMEETLSVFNFDYDWAAYRRKSKSTFRFDDGGIRSIHTSQLGFKCPVPESMQKKIQSGGTVIEDIPTQFLDLIPIRTPPRYGIPNQFLQPRYNESLPNKKEERFDPKQEWGDSAVLPRIEDSGRWENIPLCKPSRKQFYSGQNEVTYRASRNGDTQKKHKLVACIWASAQYWTRGDRYLVKDGQQRLLEWIHFNRLVGFDHFYLYDNSYALSSNNTLKPVADLFPEEVTYIKWPFQICNNNPNNVDSPGERSSQYAAKASCGLRFGPHAEWIAQLDPDEYIVPMGNFTSLLPFLSKLDIEGKNIVSFGSPRAWPRRDLIEKPVPINEKDLCGRSVPCFEPKVSVENVILQTYNCDRHRRKRNVMPAEKQIYRPGYVTQYSIYYSPVTALSELSKSEFQAAGYDWSKTRVFPDPNGKYADDVEEATMLHAKAVATQDTADWQQACMDNYKGYFMCRIGVPYPNDYDVQVHGTSDDFGWAYNCYKNKRIEEYWVPKLERAMAEHLGSGSPVQMMQS